MEGCCTAPARETAGSREQTREVVRPLGIRRRVSESREERERERDRLPPPPVPRFVVVVNPAKEIVGQSVLVSVMEEPRHRSVFWLLMLPTMMGRLTRV